MVGMTVAVAVAIEENAKQIASRITKDKPRGNLFEKRFPLALSLPKTLIKEISDRSQACFHTVTCPIFLFFRRIL